MPRFNSRSGSNDRRGSRRFNDEDKPRKNFNRNFSRPTEKFEVTCSECKQRCEVPFKPNLNKPVYCNDCFKKHDNKSSSGSGLREINKKLDKIMEALDIN